MKNEILIPFPDESENLKNGREIGIWMKGWEAGYREHMSETMTENGHHTIELQSVVHTKAELKEHYPVRYIRSEYNHQIKRMEKLGINTQGQLFEQCVNTLLMMVEKKIFRL